MFSLDLTSANFEKPMNHLMFHLTGD